MLIVITPPQSTPQDIARYNDLFALGLEALHLRLPNADRASYEQAICAIAPEYRHRLVLCDHFDLVPLVGAGGVHLSSRHIGLWQDLVPFGRRVSISAHSIEMLESLPFRPTYALLSPVFDSISKDNYVANDTLLRQRERLLSLPFPVVALGGITPERTATAIECGFAGVATLGYLAEARAEQFARFPKPSVLTIAGHDPSGGAGIVADVRTIEAEGGYPLSVCSTLTVQHEAHFEAVVPLTEEQIALPLQCLLERHRPLVAKIGLVSSLAQARWLIDLLRHHHIRYIIWDPILSASAGNGQWHQDCPADMLSALLDAIDLITPNTQEALQLLGTADADSLQGLADRHHLGILLKGGHSPEPYLSTDTLITPFHRPRRTSVPRTPHDKHGTGCVLSSSIATRLAQGYDLEQACRLGQWAVDRLRRSGLSLLGSLSPDPWQVNKRRRIATHHIQYITDSHQIDELLSRATQALEGGVRWIQLRMKRATSAERLNAAFALKALLARYEGTTLIIDDDVEVAIQVDADGVHLGLSDMPIAKAREILGREKIIGGTCNRVEDIAQRCLEGADYVGIGPWRTTQTKERLAPLLGESGITTLVHYNNSLPRPLPLVAIGGIELSDIPRLKALGVSKVAVSGLINHSDDIREQTIRLLECLR